MTSVSVILPTRDRVQLLPRAIHSVLAQTHHDLELIVVDDGSTDTTPAVVAAIADRRIRYVRNAQPAGAAAARNRGIGLARGAYLAFQDDDDIWLIERLEKQLAHLRATGADVVLSLCGQFSLEPEGPRYVGGAAFRGIDFAKGMTGDWSLIATPGWLLRKDVMDRVGGFDESLRVWHDWELALRLSRMGRIVHNPEPLLIQDRRGAGLVRDRQALTADWARLVEKWGTEERWRANVISGHCLMLGRFLCADGNLGEGRRWLRRAIGADGFNLAAWTVLLVSMAGSEPVRWLTAVARRTHRLAGRLAAG